MKTDEIKWSSIKPTKPGRYYTRWKSDGSCLAEVVISKRGHGLSVYCEAYSDRIALSKIGDDELEWATHDTTANDSLMHNSSRTVDDYALVFTAVYHLSRRENRWKEIELDSVGSSVAKKKSQI